MSEEAKRRTLSPNFLFVPDVVFNGCFNMHFRHKYFTARKGYFVFFVHHFITLQTSNFKHLIDHKIK
jgi:hypothetical protein